MGTEQQARQQLVEAMARASREVDIEESDKVKAQKVDNLVAECSDRILATLAASGYRIVKVDPLTKALAMEAMAEAALHGSSDLVNNEAYNDWLGSLPAILDAALAVLEGDEHE